MLPVAQLDHGDQFSLAGEDLLKCFELGSRACLDLAEQLAEARKCVVVAVWCHMEATAVDNRTKHATVRAADIDQWAPMWLAGGMPEAVAKQKALLHIQTGCLCVHARNKYYCKDCGGKGICSHGRQKHRCKDCGGKGLCPHGREKYTCKDCGGTGICLHGRRKTYCKDCGSRTPAKRARKSAKSDKCKSEHCSVEGLFGTQGGYCTPCRDAATVHYSEIK